MKAFTLLAEEYPAERMLLDGYGDGDQLIEMKSLVVELGTSQKVTFKGN